MTQDCACGKGPTLLFACSGAADVGAVSDLAVRELVKRKAGFMCCTAAVAAEIPEIVEKARQAARIVSIDGCKHLCARKVLEGAGLKPAPAVCLEDWGYPKGKTGVSEETLQKVAERVLGEMGQEGVH